MAKPKRFRCVPCKKLWRYPQWMDREPEHDLEEKLCPECQKASEQRLTT